MGTPEFAVPAFHAVAAICDVVTVVTRPDQPRGRGRLVADAPVARAAEPLGIPCLKPADPRDAATLQHLKSLEPDLFAVVAFGAILSRDLLAVPRLGSINLHGSLLPDYRGASPVQRALWDGRTSTGLTTLWMDEGIDTGDLILQRWEPIRPEDDAATLAARLAQMGAGLLAESLRLAHAGAAPRLKQDRAAGSYAAKLTKADGAIDWELDAESVWNRQRAVTPWPGATTGHRGKPLKIVRARPLHDLPLGKPPGTLLEVTEEGVAVACRLGALLLERVKPEGRSEMTAADWARGARVGLDERLGAAQETAA